MGGSWKIFLVYLTFQWILLPLSIETKNTYFLAFQFTDYGLTPTPLYGYVHKSRCFLRLPLAHPLVKRNVADPVYFLSDPDHVSGFKSLDLDPNPT